MCRELGKEQKSDGAKSNGETEQRATERRSDIWTEQRSEERRSDRVTERIIDGATER